MSNRAPRRQSQPYAEAKRASSPMIIDEDSRLVTRAGRARIRYCFKGKNNPDRASVAGILGTSVTALDRVLANCYNRIVDDIDQDEQFISTRFKNWVTLMCQNLQYMPAEPETKKDTFGKTSTKKGSIKSTSEVVDAVDSVRSTIKSRKRKLDLQSQSDSDVDDTNTQSAAPPSKRSRPGVNPRSRTIATVELTVRTPSHPNQPSKKLRRFFKRLGYQDETSVLGRLVQCGTTESILLTMHGMLENRVASRLQTLNSLIETDGACKAKFTLAELELLAYKIASASDSDWSLLCDED